ncbi:putative Zn finger protein [Prauserella shujinwangii]|uniref:Putative Zn finger protein n=1 Tax=Prauserella shujinwangii TaxID=1453103 RepID=A0A2T0M357_9PSEU|nr:putative Zn finger protein [Prauserella shujinwangii]
MARRVFGTTWWGGAWVAALEQRARLDPNRLPRGRTYARKGQVGGLSVVPGRVTARVRGSRPVPYRVTVEVRRFTAREWDVLLTAVAGRAGHAAALLDAELPPELADHARAAGADLLPGPGDVRPRCSCPDTANPCKHAAAVCYLVADEVDADPFVLFLLRGRERDTVLAHVRARRAPPRAATGETRFPDEPGVAPEQAFGRAPAAVPAPAPAPPAPGRPIPPAVGPPPASGLSIAALSVLATDAAERAWALLAGAGDTGLELTWEDDLARRAAAGPPDGLPALAAAAGVPVRELARRAAAWRVAGRGGLAVLRGGAAPPAACLAEAKADLAESGEPGPTRVWRDRVTRGGVQLRYGEDGRWYPFRRAGGGWELTGPGATRPLDLLYAGC